MEVEVDLLHSCAEFEVSPVPARIDTGILRSAGIIVLLSAEEEEACLCIPSACCLEAFCGVLCRVKDSLTCNIGRLITEGLPVAGNFECIGKFMVKSLDCISVKEFLPVDACRVSCAVADCVVAVC